MQPFGKEPKSIAATSLQDSYLVFLCSVSGALEGKNSCFLCLILFFFFNVLYLGNINEVNAYILLLQ